MATARKQSSRKTLNSLDLMRQRGVAEENMRIYLFTIRQGPTHAAMQYGKTVEEIERICLDIETNRSKKGTA